MKTQKEIETLDGIYDTSQLLLELFSKYKDYDSTLIEHYDSNSLFNNRNQKSSYSYVNDNTVSIIKHKETFIKRIIDKIKHIF